VYSQIVVSSVEELDLFHEQAVGVPLLMRIWVEFTTNDYIGAPQPDVNFEGLYSELRGPIYKMSHDLSYDYRKFVVRSTYDSDLKRAEISLRNRAYRKLIYEHYLRRYYDFCA